VATPAVITSQNYDVAAIIGYRKTFRQATTWIDFSPRDRYAGGG
jgi:hypothetical protein